jgi:glutamate decarboxylase
LWEARKIATSEHKLARASIESMYRIFTIPEAPDSTLGQIDQDVSQNLAGFLQSHIVAVEQELQDLEADFSHSEIPEEPTFVSEHTQFLLDKVVAQSVHTASPSFIGHMTTALPYFMLPLSKIMIALNQNLVKTETSKVFTPLERQVLANFHRLVFEQDDAFYKKWMHNAGYALGAMCSGGTIANITALWVARNSAFAPQGDFKGLSQEGWFAALKHYGYDGAVILVSRRGHYSLSKAADVLGVGRKNIVAIDTDAENRICLDKLVEICASLKANNIKVMAIVGIAGTTETGHIDPLDRLADIAEANGAYYHVDAAWGGPTLFSSRYKHLMKGIERADSVTLDAHKQLYIPMGCGMVVFKEPEHIKAIEHHAQYIIRQGSKDLGSTTLEGSRPGMAMLLHSGLHIISRSGYEILIDQGIAKAKRFAKAIIAHPDFELVSAPQLNILTYRYAPSGVQQVLHKTLELDASSTFHAISNLLDQLTKRIQKIQRERGLSFVSRTRLEPACYKENACLVFRVVLANPLTTDDILIDILAEQLEIVSGDEQLCAWRDQAINQSQAFFAVGDASS